MAQKCEMKLLGAAGSAFVTRVKLVLKLKCIEYEYIEEDLTNKSELLLTSNPVFKHVPVLFHANEKPVIESLVIMQYLDVIQPDVHPLFPSNPSDRFQCQILAYIFDTVCYPWIKEFLVTHEERREELKGMLTEAFEMLEDAYVKLSKGKAFFGGDEIGYLDVVVGSFIGWIKFKRIVYGFNLIDEARTPKLIEWEKRMWSHEVVRSVIPSQQEHEDIIKSHQKVNPPLPQAPISSIK